MVNDLDIEIDVSLMPVETAEEQVEAVTEQLKQGFTKIKKLNDERSEKNLKVVQEEKQEKIEEIIDEAKEEAFELL